ncbi:MAG TPA: pentapeptide repeat-containing protein [Planctomycetota bacterium]|mgnify:CR=1 FL=1|nr:pentapeptide repeat-containing protein [Planctomycetota bacterium]OQC22112.1 MAG: Serine/threonine-protein kinase B [Planctomycetes bacterium ADurb.Bin069]NMD35083.1 pentapeptide repeat-containing protein [Planctomycetota bacterium]HNS00372.1 pentapeptide repeat-containing protein [Planctomycetota bacterium]HNU25754.1 pentapeptide repeat-containing protein [Planctomycetota bacterium]
MLRSNSTLRILRVVFNPWLLALALGAGLAFAAANFFFGTNGDLHRLKLRLFVDGAAPRHRFDAGSNHDGVFLRNLNLRGSYFPGVTLRNARLGEAQLDKAVFERCDLRGAELRNAVLRQAVLRACRLEGADLREADLTGADLSGCSLRSALLAGAKLDGADLAHADLHNAVGLSLDELPEARNWHLAAYDADTALSIAKHFQQAGLAVTEFASWNDWLVEQKKPAVTHEGGVPQGPP